METKNIYAMGLALIFVILMLPWEVGAVPAYGDYGNYYKICDPACTTTKLAEYNFNEGSGLTTNDDSGLGKTGSLSNVWDGSQWDGPDWVNERDLNLNQPAALEFDGTDDYVQVSDDSDFDFDGPFVVSALIWIPSTCTKTTMMICSKDKVVPDPLHPSDPAYSFYYGFAFYLTNGILRFTVYNGQCGQDPTKMDGIMDVTSQTQLRDSKWHFVAFEFYNNQYRLFIDPTVTSGEVRVKSATLLPGTNDQDFFIGRRNRADELNDNSYNTEFEGIIDCLYLYEISSNQGSVPDRPWGPGNKGFWGFDEGSVPAPFPMTNDRVRFDYHSWGYLGGNTNPTLRYSRNRVCGEYSCIFNGPSFMDHVLVPDILTGPVVSYFDYTAGQGAEKVYIELWFKINDYSYSFFNPKGYTLVSRLSSSSFNTFTHRPTGTSNGYFINVVQTAYGKNKVQFGLCNTGVFIGQTPNSVINSGTWYHLWASAYNGMGYLTIEDINSVPISNVQFISYGIGPAENDLYFGVMDISYGGGLQYDYLIGNLDNIVMGNLNPGLGLYPGSPE